MAKKKKELTYIATGQRLTDLERNNRMLARYSKILKIGIIIGSIIGFSFLAIVFYVVFMFSKYHILSNILNEFVAACL